MKIRVQNEAKQFASVLKNLAIVFGKDCNIETELFF
jgi:hypothetical protein